MREYTQDAYAPQTQEPPVTYAVDGLGKVVTGANILVTIILVAAMYYDSHSATVAALAGVCYYALSTSLTLLTLSGTLTHTITNRQIQVTLRRRDALQYNQPNIAQLALARPTETQRTLAVDPVQGAGVALGPNYVPAMPADKRVARAAVLWLVANLYGEDGEPNPERVSLKGGTEAAGRLKIKSPDDAEVKHFLLEQKVLRRVRQGIRLNIEDFPNTDSLRWLIR